MVVHGKKAAYGQLNTMDRLSDLPDSIIHHIISFLDTQEACRTSILLKRWTNIWSTGLILDFRPQCFVPKIDGIRSTSPYSKENVERFMNFIESAMRRYSEENLSIRKFTLEYPIIDQEMCGRIDRWVGIALRNRVETLSLSVIKDNWQDPPPYTLSVILFSAKSLISMKLYRVRLPYIEDANLTSLRSLDLMEVDVDQHMLQRIFMSSPLKILKLVRCSGLPSILIPSCSRLESVYIDHTVPIGGTILVDTTSLQHFTYYAYLDSWNFILAPTSWKNLRELCISNAFIEDDIFSKLVSDLPSIEGISVFDCQMDYSITIASQTLKELRIHDCRKLSRVTMEAPKLDNFYYNGDWGLSSVINSHNNYNAYFNLFVTNLDTDAFYYIKQLLGELNCCKVLSITVEGVDYEIQIEFDESQLSYSGPGSPSDAIDVPELKLSIPCHHWTPKESTCRALIDGLLWCCRPDILSVSVNLSSDNSFINTFLEILQKKVKYWKHPLKRMEIEGTNCSSFLVSWDLEVQLRLYW